MADAGRRVNGRIYFENGLVLSGFQYKVVYDAGPSGPNPRPIPDGDIIFVSDLFKKFPKGHYVVRIKGHVFALIHGIAFDADKVSQRTQVRTQVLKVWKFNVKSA